MIKNLLFVAALTIAPCLAMAANPSANLSVQVVPAVQGQGNAQIVQEETGTFTPAQCATIPSVWSLSQVIQPGDVVLISAVWEFNGSCPGVLDTILVGSQPANYIANSYPSGNYGSGPAMTNAAVLNVSGSPQSITFTSSSGQAFANPVALVMTEVSGLSAGATVDQAGVQFLTTTNVNSLTSPTITPSMSGDFLWGVGAEYDFTPPSFSARSGWTLGAQCGTACYFPLATEHILQYNSTSPIAANFVLSSTQGNNESWAGIIAIKP